MIESCLNQQNKEDEQKTFLAYYQSLEAKLINIVNDNFHTKESRLAQVEKKITELSNKYCDLLTKSIENKAKCQKIDELCQYNQKMKEQFASHETRLNKYYKESTDSLNKFDKVLIENLTMPGLIGSYCKFKNMREYINNLNQQLNNLIFMKNKASLDIEGIQKKMDEIIPKFTSQLNQIVKTQNNHAQCISSISELKNYFNENIKETNEKFSSLLSDNNKNTHLLKSANDNKKTKERISIYSLSNNGKDDDNHSKYHYRNSQTQASFLKAKGNESHDDLLMDISDIKNNLCLIKEKKRSSCSKNAKAKQRDFGMKTSISQAQLQIHSRKMNTVNHQKSRSAKKSICSSSLIGNKTDIDKALITQPDECNSNTDKSKTNTNEPTIDMNYDQIYNQTITMDFNQIKSTEPNEERHDNIPLKTNEHENQDFSSINRINSDTIYLKNENHILYKVNDHSDNSCLKKDELLLKGKRLSKSKDKDLKNSTNGIPFNQRSKRNKLQTQKFPGRDKICLLQFEQKKLKKNDKLHEKKDPMIARVRSADYHKLHIMGKESTTLSIGTHNNTINHHHSKDKITLDSSLVIRKIPFGDLGINHK